MDTTKIGAEELLAHSRWLRGLAQALVRDGATADDLVQETWLRALKHPPQGDRPVRPWLARLARNLARSHQRGERVRAGHEQLLEPAPPERAGAEVVAEIEAQSLVVQALLALDEPLRTALALRYFRGLDSTAIARLTGSSPSTVRWRIQRGLGELRARLDRRFHGERKAWLALLAPLGRLAEAERLASATLPVGVVQLLQAAGVAALVLALGGWLGWAVFLRAPRATGLGAAGAATPIAVSATDSSASSVQATDSGERTAVAVVPPRESASPGSANASARVELRCVDLFGRALADVQLLEAASQRVIAASDRDGFARFAHSAPGGETAWWVKFVAAKPGYAARPLSAVLHAGSTANLGEIALAEGGAATGRVLDPAGRPVAAARVGTMEVAWLHGGVQHLRLRGPEKTTRPVETTTDAQGLFQLEGLLAGPAQVWAKGVDTTYGFSAVIDVSVARFVRDVEIVLEPFAHDERIRGVVLDPAGVPVPHAELGVFHDGGVEYMEADADGRFEIIADAKGPITLRAEDPMRKHSAATRDQVQPGEDEIVLQLDDSPRIDMRVSDPAGRPVEHYGIFPSASMPDFLPWAADFQHPGGRSAFAVPDASSTFIVRANGYARATLGPWEPEQLPRELSVVLDPTPSGVLLRGRVVADGAPVAGAEVALFPSAPDGDEIYANDIRCKFLPFEGIRGRTDGQGRFLLAYEPVGGIACERAGPLWVRAVGEGRAPALVGPLHLDPAQPAQELELVLSRGGVIAGRVASARGVAPAGTIVRANCGDGLPFSQRVGWDGMFRFEQLTPGPWDVSVAEKDVAPSILMTMVKTGNAPLEGNCTVVEGETTYLELELPVAETCALAGRLVIDDLALSGWLASVHSLDDTRQAEPGARAHTALARDGSFRLEVTGAGRYGLFLMGPAGPDTSLRLFETLDLEAGERAWQADLRLGRVQGVVGPASMSSRTQWTCIWHPGQGLAWSAPIRPDPAGRFALSFPAGHFSIRDESRGEPIELDLAPGGQVEAQVP